jgi:hypothetical protein
MGREVGRIGGLDLNGGKVRGVWEKWNSDKAALDDNER